MTFPDRLGCSTISFQHLALPDALRDVRALGFQEIDLGALPGVCDHVPFELDDRAIDAVAATIADAGIRVRSVNGDVGDLNVPAADPAARREHLERLLRLTAAIGAEALVLPCGALDHEPAATLEVDVARVAHELAVAGTLAEEHGTRVWVESIHFLRLCWNAERAAMLHERTPASVRAVLDLAHVVAAGDDVAAVVDAWGDRTAHVHLRDAVRGDFARPIGGGDVDLDAAFAALASVGYEGGFTLELPARAYTDDATATSSPAFRAERLAAIDAAARHVVPKLEAAGLAHRGVQIR
ncbi:sugar phosphate isomerase/epimerase family protein [Agrococcus sp. SGAir0287]|uniref:sugar phosphate isomerase/epimerase family protein n=1 Tax=Agrococcus sp. SGAir0287 TaxID=2070347 RepID=UPI0010CCF72C|nr:sugar phosphate isomerase/epimerase [Agrococcus sp. SGAir0287]QCR20317.1 xylose isomerase [Agrococcus sp. SGAir0287]